LQKILVPNDFEMKFNLGKNVLFSTLYNPNYVGSYMVMILPIAVSLFLYSKKGIMNIIYWFISALIFANLIGCRSTGGFIAAVIAGVVFLMFFKSKLLKEKRKIIILFISFLGIFVLLDLKFNGDIIGDIIRNITKTKVAEEEKNEVLIEDIELKNDELIISEKDKALKIKITDDIRIYDEEDNQLDVSVDNNYILIDDEENNYYKIMIADESSGIIFIENKKVYFSFLKNGKMLLHGSKYMIYDQLKDVETFGFKGMEGFATKRGYIWSRTFPLLKDYLLIGSGPDTYVFVFPQYDLLGKLNAYNSFGTIIDKPHNLYLQIAINTGLISLLAFLGIVIVYFVSCIKLFWKKNLTKVEEYIGMSIFISVLAYCIAGLGNDSVVSVAPIFWILLGVGISINYRLNKHNEIV
ncbi:MAG: O-antigen ligase family protein, partial [Eubacteriales bacterium]